MSEPEFEYLGPYKVERVLGRGGMGTVYKGIHAKSGESVAIKVIAPGIANNMRFRRRFNAEVETLKQLTHPNIVQLVGYGEEQGLLFYSMEYVDGHSLHEHLRQHKKLAWEDVIQVGIETAAALKHAHDLGVIHRDLKPANLMLNESGRVKLTDFGIAKLFGASENTAVGSVIGTADYMPPEQAEGKAVNFRSDLYSLGGVMYALLTGKAPFGGKSVPEVLYSVRYNPVPNLQERCPEIPSELAELIHQLLEKEQSKRPPTALVLGNRLKSMQEGLKLVSPTRQSDSLKTIDARSEAIRQKDERMPVVDMQTRVVGPQLTSLDLSDVADSELKLTGEEQIAAAKNPDGLSDRHESSNTHELATLIASESLVDPPSEELPTSSRDSLPVKGRAPFSGAFQSANPIASTSSGSSPGTSGGPSHFTPIDDKTVRTSTIGFEDHASEPGIDWVHYASVVGIAVTLLVSLGFGWYLMRPQSADGLYSTIAAATDSGDEFQLQNAKDSIKEFLTRFPKDERHEEVQLLADEIDFNQAAKNLRRTVNRGGVQSLSAIQQGFLECIKARDRDTEEAQAKLIDFLRVFGSVSDLPRSEQRLVDLAEYALQTAGRRSEKDVNMAGMQLQARIESAEKTLSEKELNDFYASLLSLYGDMPWADEQIQRIREKLQTDS